jgi:hypothetical protein
MTPTVVGWAVIITCMSDICLPMPHVNAVYATKARCEQVLRTVVRRWRPSLGSYSFECRGQQ